MEPSTTSRVTIIAATHTLVKQSEHSAIGSKNPQNCTKQSIRSPLPCYRTLSVRGEHESADRRIQLASAKSQGGNIYQTESTCHEQRPGKPPFRHLQPNYQIFHQNWANTCDTKRTETWYPTSLVLWWGYCYCRIRRQEQDVVCWERYKYKQKQATFVYFAFLEALRSHYNRFVN